MGKAGEALRLTTDYVTDVASGMELYFRLLSVRCIGTRCGDRQTRKTAQCLHCAVLPGTGTLIKAFLCAPLT